MPDEWRQYRLVRITGWTEDEIDAADAVTCDWFLAFDDVERQLDRRHAGEVRRARLT